MTDIKTVNDYLRTAIADFEGFSRLVAPRKLRPYQLEAGEAITRSILRGEGKTFVVMMARQSGKNELSAQIEAFLLNLYSERGGTIVKCAPTFRPQIANSNQRVREMLGQPLLAGHWSSRDHIIQFRMAELHFYSAAPGSHVVGDTASLGLEVDEPQDVDSTGVGRPLTSFLAEGLHSRLESYPITAETKSQLGHKLLAADPCPLHVVRCPVIWRETAEDRQCVPILSISGKGPSNSARLAHAS